MKKITSLRAFKSALLLKVFIFIAALQSYAQEKKIDVDINAGAGNDSGFFGSPWVWIVGAAIFILLLVALLRGGRRTG